MKPKILVIDDDAPIRKVLEAFLRNQFEVTSKEDGFEAIAWMKDNHLPDLIVADLTMPTMNGYEFIAKIKSNKTFKGIPLIILSGVEDQEIREKCFHAGVDSFMVKPPKGPELLASINSLLKINS